MKLRIVTEQLVRSETGLGDEVVQELYVVDTLVNCLKIMDFLGVTRC